VLIEYIENGEMDYIGVGAFNFFLTAFAFVVDECHR
jgi:hypothetical protein